MKKAIALFYAMLLGACFMVAAGAAHGGNHMDKSVQGTKIRIVFGGEEVVVALFDNHVSRDFVSLLPLETEFEDYARTEKITYLTRKLKTQGGAAGDFAQGDFAYYAPWGNLAVFYKGLGSGNSNLYHLGRIESGKEKLSGMNKNFTARIEIAE